jgi:hypothetical protein
MFALYRSASEMFQWFISTHLWRFLGISSPTDDISRGKIILASISGWIRSVASPRMSPAVLLQGCVANSFFPPTFGLRAEYPDPIPVAISQSPSIIACAIVMRIGCIRNVASPHLSPVILLQRCVPLSFSPSSTFGLRPNTEIRFAVHFLVVPVVIRCVVDLLDAKAKQAPAVTTTK